VASEGGQGRGAVLALALVLLLGGGIAAGVGATRAAAPPALPPRRRPDEVAPPSPETPPILPPAAAPPSAAAPPGAPPPGAAPPAAPPPSYTAPPSPEVPALGAGPIPVGYVDPRDPGWFVPGADPKVAAAAALSYARAVQNWQAEAVDRANGSQLGADELAKVKGAIKDAGTAAGAIATVAGLIAAGSQAAPVVGQIVGAVAAAIAFCAYVVSKIGEDTRTQSERERGGPISTGWTKYSWSASVVSGWYGATYSDGGLRAPDPCYYFLTVPVAGPYINTFVSQLSGKLSEYNNSILQGLQALCLKWPYGPPDAVFVRVRSASAYEYKFVGMSAALEAAALEAVAPAAAGAPGSGTVASIKIPSAEVGFVGPVPPATSREYKPSIATVKAGDPWRVSAVEVKPGWRLTLFRNGAQAGAWGVGSYAVNLEADRAVVAAG